MIKETIIIDGVRYYADRPRSCRGCFFWKNRKVGCTLKKENCYYLAESPKPTSPCAGCSYGPSLTPDQMKTFEEKFHSPEVFIRMGKGIMAVPLPDEKVEKPQDKKLDAPEVKPHKKVKEEVL